MPLSDSRPPGMPLSITGRRWVWRATAEEHHQRAAAALGAHPALAPLLAYRRLESQAAADAFLNPRLGQLTDPLELKDMERAVARLILALERQERLAVFGDYDVDGATSSALLVRYFRAIGVPLRVYIPDRQREGYGPTIPAMETLAGEGIQLLITVDCGITAHPALERARALGMAVIVTDHHQGREPLPPAHALVNPNRLDDPFPHKELAGVGVAFYLLMALNRALRQRGWFSASRPEPDLKGLLDLVAVGTIADVARLSGINRPLVAAGLRQAERGGNIGLAALIKAAGVKLPLGAGHVGFQIGPRLNAGGRVGNSAWGCELLSTGDPARAAELAARLDAANEERQAIEQTILEAVLEQVEREGLLECRTGLVVAGRGWHSGVIGIVASRLVERFHRPAAVVALDDNGIGKGSARSVPGVDLLAAVEAGAAFLEERGGHKAAAGFTVREEQLAAFSDAFDSALKEGNPPERFIPTLTVDAPLPMEVADQEMVAWLERLKPFGMGNPEPVLVLEQVRNGGGRPLQDKHVKCRINGPQGQTLEAIAFNCLPGPLGEALLLPSSELVDVAGTLSINRFRGQETVQLMVKDVRRR